MWSGRPVLAFLVALLPTCGSSMTNLMVYPLFLGFYFFLSYRLILWWPPGSVILPDSLDGQPCHGDPSFECLSLIPNLSFTIAIPFRVFSP